MSGFAGTLRERVAISRSGTGRDAIGAAAGEPVPLGEAWAAIAPAGTGQTEVGGARAALPLWRLAMRDRDLAVGDRIAWRSIEMVVRSVTRDPAVPDRLGAIGEETG